MTRWSTELHGKHIVTIGGGTGPFALLSTVKRYPCKATAVVTMADSGGSSRRLMDEFGQLPLGDLRQALVALSRKGALWRDIFAFRFPSGLLRADDSTLHVSMNGSIPGPNGHAGVGGHSLGNLVLSALQDMNDGNLLHALLDAQELLDTAGNVLPVTLSRSMLCAKLMDGSVVNGEDEIDTRGRLHPEPLVPISQLFLRDRVKACSDTVRAIRRADMIVMGPGDLYTSILPNLLVDGIPEALRASEARKIYVCSLMTKHGETDGFCASDFVREIHRYLGQRVDRIILHDGLIQDRLIAHYASQQQHPVQADVEVVRRLVPDVIVDHLVPGNPDHLVRHDPERLTRAIFSPSDDYLGPDMGTDLDPRSGLNTSAPAAP